MSLIFLLTVLTAVVFGSTVFNEGDRTSEEEDDAEAPRKREDQQTSADHRKIPFLTITGDTTSLADYDGKVLLLVNVASKCGFTSQYAELEELYGMYKDSGLVILGFPANNFGRQEPGSNEEILNFCQVNFGVTFPMMAKISVKGKDKHPLYAYFTEHSDLPGEIKWNFHKFLLDRNGQLVARFGSRVRPLSDKIVEQTEKLL